MMKLIWAILGAASAYGLSAFVAADFDFRAWGADGRFACALLMVFCGAAGLIARIDVERWR